MRTLAVDLGTRRVGLALSDEGGRFASPYQVIEVNGAEQALLPIAALVAKEGVRRIVIGLPLNMDDTLGPPAHAALAWGRQLAAQTGQSVVFVDERLSSFEAEQQLTQRRRAGEKLTHARKKQQRDALAACAFLQSFLDGKLPAIPSQARQG